MTAVAHTEQDESELRAILSRLTPAQLGAVTRLLKSIDTEPDLNEALTLIVELEPAERSRVLRFARVLAEPIPEMINKNSDLVGAAFANEFRTSLRVHHATRDSHLEKVAFEHVFVEAVQAEGREAQLAPSRTTRFWDVMVDGSSRYSAKTTAAKNLNPNWLHISKLSEAAWIQDCRSARARHQKTIEFFENYLSIVDRSIILRTFIRLAEFHYELTEIPMRFFNRILDLQVSDFSSDAPRISVLDTDGAPLLQLVLDRSDSKITIGKIPKTKCIVHAEWNVARGRLIDPVVES